MSKEILLFQHNIINTVTQKTGVLTCYYIPHSKYYCIESTLDYNGRFYSYDINDMYKANKDIKSGEWSRSIDYMNSIKQIPHMGIAAFIDWSINHG